MESNSYLQNRQQAMRMPCHTDLSNHPSHIRTDISVQFVQGYFDYYYLNGFYTFLYEQTSIACADQIFKI